VAWFIGEQRSAGLGLQACLYLAIRVHHVDSVNLRHWIIHSKKVASSNDNDISAAARRGATSVCAVKRDAAQRFPELFLSDQSTLCIKLQ
jgi:hypothetical protein